jgi:phage baseplate assembly protein W
MIMRQSLYRGFSTADFQKTKTFSVVNQELVKRDLLNYIYTIPGERPHMPDFGTRIPLLTFELLDDITLNIIREDLRKAVNYDPRLQLLDMVVLAAPDANSVIAALDVRYVELNVVDTIRLDFARSL